jgi:hypothetical protein
MIGGMTGCYRSRLIYAENDLSSCLAGRERRLSHKTKGSSVPSSRSAIVTVLTTLVNIHTGRQYDSQFDRNRVSKETSRTPVYSTPRIPSRNHLTGETEGIKGC